MGFLWFGRKKEIEEIKKTVDGMKSSIEKIVEWIKHLNNKDNFHENSISEFNSKLSTIEFEIENIKNFISFFSSRTRRLSKQLQTAVYKQTAVEGVQTPVQASFQTEFLKNLTTMERVIIWVLLNSNLKLSYEDIAALLGKNRSTIRGQINSIKQKNENLLEELIEKNGKKRFFINSETKEILLRSIKTEKAKKKR